MPRVLEDSSITELRAIAQSMGVTVSFADDKRHMLEKIKAARDARVPKPVIPDVLEPVDTRLAIRPPKTISTQKEIVDACKAYIDRGLKIRFPTEDSWLMNCGAKEDSGTLRMPIRSIVRCAEAVCQ